LLYGKVFIFICLAFIMKIIPILLFVLIFVPAAYSFPVINEIMYNPSQEQGDDADLEWIELFSNESVDLNNYHLDGKNLNGSFSGYFIIARGKQKFDEFYPGLNCGVIQATISLTNLQDNINLSNLVYSEIVNYSSSIGGDGNGKTLERRNNSWSESFNVNGTPCRENSFFINALSNISNSSFVNNQTVPNSSFESNQTPVNISLGYISIKITALMPNPEGDDSGKIPGGEWIEVYNSANMSVNLSGLSFYDNGGHQLRIFLNNTAELNVGGFSYSKIYRNGDTRFSLNNDNEIITLKDSYGNAIDVVSYNTSKEGSILRNVNNVWIPEEKPVVEKTGKKSSSSKAGSRKVKRVEVISDKKTEIKKSAKVSKTTTTTIKIITPGIIYQSSDRKAGNSGVVFFGFTLVLLLGFLLFRKDL